MRIKTNSGNFQPYPEYTGPAVCVDVMRACEALTFEPAACWRRLQAAKNSEFVFENPRTQQCAHMYYRKQGLQSPKTPCFFDWLFFGWLDSCLVLLYSPESSLAYQARVLRGSESLSAMPLRLKIPAEISESIKCFRKDYPAPRMVAFIMMRFGRTRAHNEVVTVLRSELAKYSIEAVRADHKQYHDDLLWNILTYIYGCGFGIAVFERIELEEFNPNVALEVGYMMALKKPVLLLKDKTLKNLNTDLIGKLYKAFDPQAIADTLPAEVEQWLKDKGIVKSEKEQQREALAMAEFVVDPVWQSLSRLSGKSLDQLFSEFKESTSRDDFMSRCLPGLEQRMAFFEGLRDSKDEERFRKTAKALRERLGLGAYPSRQESEA